MFDLSCINLKIRTQSPYLDTRVNGWDYYKGKQREFSLYEYPDDKAGDTYWVLHIDNYQDLLEDPSTEDILDTLARHNYDDAITYLRNQKIDSLLI